MGGSPAESRDRLAQNRLLLPLDVGRQSGRSRRWLWQRRAALWAREARDVALGAIGAAVATGGIAAIGVLQPFELFAYDRLLRSRPPEPPPDRVVMVTSSEVDIARLSEWPLTDASLARAIRNLQALGPRAIGVDLARNMPVPPGREALAAIWTESPLTIGIEKRLGEAIGPPVDLHDRDRVGFADLLPDRDGRIRRNLLATQADDGTLSYSFSLRLALAYLAQEGIQPESIDAEGHVQRLGRATIEPLSRWSGGYTHLDDSGYQILLNYRGDGRDIPEVSIVDVLADRVPEDRVRDRVVILGTIAESTHDNFYTPYSGDRAIPEVPGAEIHAQSVLQLLSSALDGRPVLRPVPPWGSVLAIAGGALVGAIAFHRALLVRSVDAPWLPMLVRGGVLLAVNGAIVAASYGLLRAGWWMPTVGPMFAATGAAALLAIAWSFRWQRIAYLDELTQLPNRFYFSKTAEDAWIHSRTRQRPLSLILCDIDYFKQYNDCYGHVAGDRCLQQVAAVLAQAVRPEDFVARYGGEEFIVVLRDTDLALALQVADRLRRDVKALAILHEQSPAEAACVTLSCGVASAVAREGSSLLALMEAADTALYRAKAAGRDRAVAFYAGEGRSVES